MECPSRCPPASSCLAPTRESSALRLSHKPRAGKFGGSLKEIYWTIGPYDVVAVSEAPDDESATAFALALASQGNVRTTTLRAFDADEMRGIIAKTG